VSHFRSFVKIDVFYFSEDRLQPSPWYALPVRILPDAHGVIDRLLKRSAELRFDVREDLDYSISKGLAAAHEAFRRAQRQEPLFVQTLLDELRFHIIQADDWLFERTPRTQLFSKSDQRGSREVTESLRSSFCRCDKADLRMSLAALLQLYRHQIIQLHARFPLSRQLESDLAALDLIPSELSDGMDQLGSNLRPQPRRRR
jgi:hypothetical protein